VYTVRRMSKRGLYAWIAAGVLVAALAGTAVWQFVTAPSIQAVTPSPGSFTLHTTVTVDVRIDGIDRLKGLRVRFDDRDVTGQLVVDGGRLTFRRGGLADGAHTVTVRASTSNLYRRHVSRSWQFTVDTSAPRLAVDSPRRGATFTSTPLTVTGSTEPGATLSVGDGSASVTGRAGADGRFSIAVSPPDGRQQLAVRAADRAGNVTTVRRRVIVDTQGPTLGVTVPSPATSATPTIDVIASDAVGVPRVAVLVDGKGVYDRKLSGKRQMEIGPLSEGRHVLLVTATDRSRHVTSHADVFLVDSSEKFGEATMSVGAVGADVRELQRLLRKNKAYVGPLTAVYDMITLKAVRRFQRRNNITADGVAGQFVQAALVGRIVIDQSECLLYFYQFGKLKLKFGVATGMPAYPTPNGFFHVVIMAKNPTWIPPDSPWAKGLEPIPPGSGNPLGTRWIGTSAPGVGIHGTPADWTIGTHASHGCIRMHIWEVEKLYDYVRVGMPVIIRW